MRPWALGSQIFLRSSIVNDLTHVFLGLTTTVSASNAIGNSMYFTPASRQAAISSFRIGRDAFEMSTSPRQKRLKPPPVPEIPTVTRTPPRLLS